jgi:hypothetical protein
MPKRRDKSEPPGASAFGTMMLVIAASFAAFPEHRNWRHLNRTGDADCGADHHRAPRLDPGRAAAG